MVAVMLPYFTELFFNPSSPYAPAVQVRREYEAAKSRLAVTFGAKGDEIVMTAGATESINLAFAGVSGHVVTSAIEHDAVLAAASMHQHALVQPTSKGIITAEAVQAAIQPNTELVSIQLANNEIGTVQPIRAIAAVVEQERQRRLAAGDQHPIVLHCDGSQGFGMIDVHTARLGVDLLTLNSGKIYGPKQVGLLWVRPGTTLTPLIVGGGQERGLRSGTENVAGAVGFAKAAELADKHRTNEAKRLSGIRDEMQKIFANELPEAIFSGHPKKRLPNSLHLSVAGIDAERLVFSLEAKHIYLATGSACAANKGSRSHVLAAIGLDELAIQGSLRITLGRFSDQEDCLEAARIICQEIIQEKTRLSQNA